ncbi:Single-stranded DNA-binding protein [Leucobacter sp. 7(1)]|uniref:single-stranded DNA-binding protein n=1 Tax=Leucobacter sp. 7(1) TaxID=1255613 RepID=UPI00097F3279|nr:single-stranded DNA-binding protein [Leucobacter sp. 7(1)]SJN08354.1 Single-stranded DNA-binding protein [Leucobacter sp. 7(1)]
MSTTVSIVGTIGTTPRLLRSAANVAFCSFRVANTPRRYDRDTSSWVDGETSWYTVNAFRGLAEHAKASLSLGDRVVVSGRLRVRDWKADDRSGTNVELEADGLGHDLRWGTTRFSATPRPQELPETANAQEGTSEVPTSTDPAGGAPSAVAPVPSIAGTPTQHGYAAGVLRDSEQADASDAGASTKDATIPERGAA